MDTILNRYRNISVLVLLLLGQLLLLAYQVKTHEDVRVIRIWAVTAVTPVARAVEWVRSGAGGAVGEYFALRSARRENEQLKRDLASSRLENYALKSQLGVADRAKALLAFRETTQSKTLPARVIGTGTGLNSRTVFIDRGSTDGIKKDMAVITADGIVGKVSAAYPTASLVVLATSQGFAAGVVSQTSRIKGTLKGDGSSQCPVDHISNQAKIEVGEMFYTSGDDRIFPRGLPAGVVRVAREGRSSKEVIIDPIGFRNGIDEVLVVTEGVHGLVPDPLPPPSNDINILPAPPGSGAPGDPGGNPATAAPGPVSTDADRVLDRYKKLGEAQGHVYGGNPGRPPDFNRQIPAEGARPAPAPQNANPGQNAAPPATAAPSTAPGTARPSVPTQPSTPPNARPGVAPVRPSEGAAPARPSSGAGTPPRPQAPATGPNQNP